MYLVGTFKDILSLRVKNHATLDILVPATQNKTFYILDLVISDATNLKIKIPISVNLRGGGVTLINVS